MANCGGTSKPNFAIDTGNGEMVYYTYFSGY